MKHLKYTAAKRSSRSGDVVWYPAVHSGDRTEAGIPFGLRLTTLATAPAFLLRRSPFGPTDNCNKAARTGRVILRNTAEKRHLKKRLVFFSALPDFRGNEFGLFGKGTLRLNINNKNEKRKAGACMH